MNDQEAAEINLSIEAEQYRAFMKELNNLGVEMLASLNRIDHLVRNISSELRAAHKEVSEARIDSRMADGEERPSA